MRRYFACIKTPEFKKMKGNLSVNESHQTDNSFIVYTYTSTLFNTTRHGTYYDQYPLPKFTVGHFYVTDNTELVFYDDAGYRFTIEEEDLSCFEEFKFEYDDKLKNISKKLCEVGCSLLITPHTFFKDFNTMIWDISIMGKWPLFARVYSDDMVNGYLECWKQIRKKTGVCRTIKECLHGVYDKLTYPRNAYTDAYFYTGR